MAKVLISTALVCVLAVSGLGACLGDVYGQRAQMACCQTMQDCAESIAADECCGIQATSHPNAAATTVKAEISIPRLPVAVLPFAATAFIPPHPADSGVDPIDRYKPHSPPYIHHSALLI